MADTPELVIEYPSGGMNGAGCSHRVPRTQYRRATNVALVDELPTTRPGVVVYGLGEQLGRLNIQGAKFFNPAKGLDGLNNSVARPQILVAAGGLKFTVEITGTGLDSIVTPKLLSAELRTNPKLHLVWWETSENYAFAQNGMADCFVWDSLNPPFLSPGYDAIDKPSSKVPNGASVMLYAHGRLMVVVNARYILAGDAIHKSNQTNAVNLLGFTEQVYWATGAFFLPPSSMGNILAAAVLPIANTQHGHGDCIFHCEDGVFSVDINIAPRTDWPTKATVRQVLQQAGAAGPYAVVGRDRDQIYRTRHGIVDLASAAAQSQDEGNPQSPYSEPIRTFLSADEPAWLRFCSVAIWDRAHRFLCTVDPCVDGRWRWHNGLVVRNFAPKPAEKSPAAWEGLWTLPPQCSGIVQLVDGIFFEEERLFALCMGDDGRNRLVEFREDLRGVDVLEDGTRVPIRCQLLSRAVDFSTILRKEFVSGTIYFRNVVGRVEWAVWVRREGKGKFALWRGGTIVVRDDVGDLGLEQAEPFSDPISLGNFPKECETGKGVARAFEFLVRWKGYAQFETLRVGGSTGDGREEQLKTDDFSIVVEDPLAGDYSDYEYSGGAEWSVQSKKQ